jgi:hypothetical protein
MGQNLLSISDLLCLDTEDGPTTVLMFCSYE